MANPTKRQQQANLLRVFRKVHRLTGAFLFVFFFFIAITGLLLGWKKHSGNLLLAPTQKGSSANLKDWLPMDSLHQRACQYLHDSVSAKLSLELERIDIRKDKGIVKFDPTSSKRSTTDLSWTYTSVLPAERSNSYTPPSWDWRYWCSPLPGSGFGTDRRGCGGGALNIEY